MMVEQQMQAPAVLLGVGGSEFRVINREEELGI
jgi:hypothetical protein